MAMFLITQLMVTITVNSQFNVENISPVIQCGDPQIQIYHNESNNIFNFSIINYDLNTGFPIQYYSTLTFITTGIENVKLRKSTVTKSPSIPVIQSSFFNTSTFLNMNDWSQSAKFMLIFNTIPNEQNVSSMLSMICDIDENSNILPLNETMNTMGCQTITTSNTSVHYYNFDKTTPNINDTITLNIQGVDHFDAEIYSYSTTDKTWIIISSSSASSNVESTWLSDNSIFFALTNVTGSKQYYLIFGELYGQPTSYQINTTCSNINKLEIPVIIQSDMVCGDHIEYGNTSTIDASAESYYYSFHIENDELFRIFKFDTCSNCNNVFWIYGYNEDTNHWILNRDTLSDHKNYFDFTQNEYYDFQFIAHPDYIYYLRISTNQSSNSDIYYSLNVTCSKIMEKMECPKFENTSITVNSALSHAYFLHFYPFRWNYTISIPMNATNETILNITHTALSTLVLNSCNSSIITEVALLVLYNISQDPAIFFSTQFVTQRNCLLSAINVENGEYLIGIISYHAGYTGYGAYNIEMKCINSFPEIITDTLSCSGFALSATSLPQQKDYYAFTLTESQNKTIFDTCESTFDNYLALWDWNKSIDDWRQTDYCDNCGDCGQNTILEEYNMKIGTYYLEIGGVPNSLIEGIGDFGEYLISVNCRDSPPGYPVVGNISCNSDPVIGQSRASYDFYTDDGSGDHYSFSYYLFVIDDNVTKYSFKYDACSTEAIVQIYKWNSDKWIVSNECKHNSNEKESEPCGVCTNTSTERNWAVLPSDADAGTYYLAVLNQYGYGGYQVYMECDYKNAFESELEEDEKREKIVIFTLIGLLFILCIISLIAFLYNRNPETFIDDGKFWCLIEYGFQVFDFVTDINLAYELLTYVLNDYGGTGNKNRFILLSAIGATTFTVIPYLINIYKAISIKELVKNNVVSKLYFEQNTSLFVVMCLCSGGIYSTLKVLSSNVFGLKLLNCGLTSYDLKKLLPLKIYSSVLLENTPQLICQVTYAITLGHMTFNTSMSSTTSLLSIISALISFYIKNQSLMNSEAVVYYLELTRNNDLNVAEKQNMIKFKGLRKKLRYSIAIIFGVPISCFEIGYVTLTQNGCIIHLVQYVFRDDLKEIMMRLDTKLLSKHSKQHRSISMWSDMSSIGFVKTLYRICNDKVVNTLCRHFDLRNDDKQFTTKYHTSFPYKFEDNIMSNNGIEMAFNVEQQEQSMGPQDIYVRLTDHDDDDDDDDEHYRF